jgi:hypothetical protein
MRFLYGTLTMHAPFYFFFHHPTELCIREMLSYIRTLVLKRELVIALKGTRLCASMGGVCSRQNWSLVVVVVVVVVRINASISQHDTFKPNKLVAIVSEMEALRACHTKKHVFLQHIFSLSVCCLEF